MSVTSQPSLGKLVVLGVITTPHGVRGDVKIRSFAAQPESLTAYGPLQTRDGRRFKLTLIGQTNDALLARIDGVRSREDAERLKGTELCILRSQLPDTSEHEYYHEDLVGLRLVGENGAAYGHVKAIDNFGAGDLVRAQLVNGEEEYFPFTRAIFPNVDLAAGLITIRPPEREAPEQPPHD